MRAWQFPQRTNVPRHSYHRSEVMETLKLPALGQFAVLSGRVVQDKAYGCACVSSRFTVFPKLNAEAGLRRKWQIMSNKMPEAQGADIGSPSELGKLPSPDVLSALRLALPSLVSNSEPTATGTRSVEGLRKGCLIENMKIYRQAFVVRYSEVGPDKVASIETLTNLFQEVALNHVMYSGVGADGFGITKAMFECGLIWVVRRMHVEVDHFPCWGSVVELDSWVASHSRAANGMRRDWIARDIDTHRVIARGTSQWVLMDMQTRRMARMPHKVRDEITPFFNDAHAIPTEVSQKILELDEESAEYVQHGLKPHRNDLDLNLHVNNVKYIPWILESVPEHVLDTSELRSMTMEYRRECNQHDVVVSLTSSEESVLAPKRKEDPSSVSSSSPASHGVSARLWHTLRKGDASAIITAKTVWCLKGQRSDGNEKPEGVNNADSSNEKPEGVNNTDSSQKLEQ